MDKMICVCVCVLPIGLGTPCLCHLTHRLAHREPSDNSNKQTNGVREQVLPKDSSAGLSIQKQEVALWGWGAVSESDQGLRRGRTERVLNSHFGGALSRSLPAQSPR